MGGIPLPVRWCLRRLWGADVARLCRLTDGACPLRGKRFFFCGKVGCFYFVVVFLPARLGPEPLFLLLAKEKVVLDSEKEKVDQ